MKIKLLVLLLLLIHVCDGQLNRIFTHRAKKPSSVSHSFEKVLHLVSACDSWLNLASEPSYVNVGKLNITGSQLTVEANFNRTSMFSDGVLADGDLVSKHTSPSDINYLLRPTNALITTSDGFFATPYVCDIPLNKNYHVAMVYDGVTLKFYRNGFLMSQVPATGNLFQNNLDTHIGLLSSANLHGNFVGYINEVRIWNVARTQAQISAYMNSTLPSPTTQIGLQAYYIFNDLINKQGNPAWNGALSGSATINNTVPDCNFIADSCAQIVTPPSPISIPVFTAPDTICVNTPVKIANTSTGASSYYWNFCVADLNTTPPNGVNLGNPGNALVQPAFIDYVQDNGNYYGFVTNYTPGGLSRLDFGNNLLNTPTATYLGNFGGAIPANIGAEGVQIIKNEGKWYVIVVGGYTPSGSLPRISKIEFGTSLTNPNPVATNWGNIGNLYQPLDLHVFKDGNNWYGFTVNAENNTITRFDFTNSFDNIPTAVNLGNLGNLAYPTGIYAINDNGFWRLFITNGGANTRTTGIFSLTRLDFGSSLLNTPTAVNLGNPGNKLQHPRGLTIMKSCGQIVGFVVNGHPDYNDVVKLDFNNDLVSTPTAVSLGNIGNLNFPPCISKLFRSGNDLYGFVTNVGSNSITRLQFTGCTNSSIPNSTAQNPPDITYNIPGTYNINLSVDDGLGTQAAFCKQVVVVPAPVHSPLQKIIFCNIDSVKIGTGLKQVSYVWNNGATTDSIYVKNGGSYWVQSNTTFGCSNIDSFTVTIEKVAVKTNNDTIICAGKTIQLNTTGTGVSYSWSPSVGLSDSAIAAPLATPLVNTQYIVSGKGANGCIVNDSITVTVNPSPIITKTNDTTICHDKTLQLNVSGGNIYTWMPSPTLNNINIPNPVATPAVNTTYYITVTSNGNCTSSDSIKVAVKPVPIFAATPGLTICKGNPAPLIASGGDVYNWQPGAGLNNNSVNNPLATPDISTIYTVKIISSTCADSASLSTAITVLPLPVVTASSTNDVDCTKPATQLNASGALYYLWQPTLGLNNPNISTPLSSPSANTIYTVKGTDLNGCSNYDSVSILVTHSGDLLVNLPNAFTPNGDGKNDCFGVSRYAGLLQNVQLSVYDRFGLRVFYTTNPLNCWDGRYNGTLQNAGGFAYVLQANTFCGTIFKKGIVMLIK
jgi:gliding motility-associated-like protein